MRFGKYLLRASLVVAVMLALTFLGAAYYFSGLVLRVDSQGRVPGGSFMELVDRSYGERFELQSEEGYRLVGYHFPSPGLPRKLVVLTHGYGSSKSEYTDYIRLFQSFGFEVVVFDNRNSGESGGRTTTCGVRESRDLNLVFEHFYKSGDKPLVAGVFGRSMGASTALLWAGSGGRSDFIVADCPFSDFYEQAAYRLERDYAAIPSLLGKPLLAVTDRFIHWRGGFSMHDAAPKRVVSGVRQPVLYFVTREDHYVPPTMTAELHDLTRAPKHLSRFVEGGHGAAFSRHPVEYRQALKQFLDEVTPRQVVVP